MDMIKCGVCGKNRNKNRFSQTTLKRWEDSKRFALRRGNPDLIKTPRCSDCNGAPVHELRCAHCNVVKSLDMFSKQMRRNPDNALCWYCSQDRQDLEPDHKDQVAEEIAVERIRAGANITSFGTSSTALGYGAHSRGFQSNNLTSSNLESTNNWINNPIPIPDDPLARNAPSHVSSTNTNPYASPHSATASNVTGTGWDNFERTNAPYREQASFRRTSNSNSNSGSNEFRGSSERFVKQGAVRPDLATRAQQVAARRQIRESEQAEQAALKEDSSDDSDGEPAY